MKKLNIELLRNVIGGGKSWPSTLLFPLAFLAFTACTEDDPASAEPETLVDTRTPSDSIAASEDSLVHIGGITIDTAWAGEIHIHY